MTFRRALALAGLAVFLYAESRPKHFNPRERWARLVETAPLPESARSLSRAAFFFDPSYGPFLEAVERATPPGATIALDAPATHELYTYLASYLLAPRRLVSADRSSEAEYIAVYGTGRAARGERIALPAVSGSLFRVR